MSDSDNRREFFRVNDYVKMRINTPDEASLQETFENFDEFRLRYCLKTHIHYQREMRYPTLKLIRNRQPEVASYIEHLEAQIEMLAAHMIKDTDFTASDPMIPVNLSAEGVRFDSSLHFQPGQMLEIGMMLFPGETVILVIAEVVRTSSCSSAQSTTVSLAFRTIHEEDREALIRHIVKVQQSELQKRRIG